MAPTANDFSAITELMDVKRLYEEQEEKWKLRIQEKEDAVANLESDLRERDRLLESRAGQISDVEGEVQRMRQENERMRQEMATKVAQLNERIKELNQRLMGATPAVGTPPAPQSGFFKR